MPQWATSTSPVGAHHGSLFSWSALRAQGSLLVRLPQKVRVGQWGRQRGACALGFETFVLCLRLWGYLRELGVYSKCCEPLSQVCGALSEGWGATSYNSSVLGHPGSSWVLPSASRCLCVLLGATRCFLRVSRVSQGCLLEASWVTPDACR